ncbi:MAG: hypothetical protein AAF738_10915 [Bacteroidota bacterium]
MYVALSSQVIFYTPKTMFKHKGLIMLVFVFVSIKPCNGNTFRADPTLEERLEKLSSAAYDRAESFLCGYSDKSGLNLSVASAMFDFDIAEVLKYSMGKFREEGASFVILNERNGLVLVAQNMRKSNRIESLISKDSLICLRRRPYVVLAIGMFATILLTCAIPIFGFIGYWLFFILKQITRRRRRVQKLMREVTGMPERRIV